ncbi:hypothetical protein ACWEN6_13490 [Sphaerisporangium sp. NPDC004334]
MPDQWVVTGVEETTDATGRIPLWMIVYQVPPEASPDGELRYVVPREVIDFRAAEYGLTTVEEVLDLLVWEPLLGIAQAAGDLDMPAAPLLDPAAARAQIAGQIEACKDRHGTVRVGATAGAARAAKAADPLHAIRQATRIDPIRVAALRVELDRARAAHTSRR